MPEPRWLVLTWRLPSGSSTPRVAIWRGLRRLGAAPLTPGAAVLPYREDLLEQLDWLAQEIMDQSGVAWVLPVTELSDAEEEQIRVTMAAERDAEYERLAADAETFARRAGAIAPAASPIDRPQLDKELLALQRRFRKVAARDYFTAPARHAAATAIDRCLAYRQGISRRLAPVTDLEALSTRSR